MRYYKLLYDFMNSDNYVSCDETVLSGLSEHCVIEGKVIGDRWISMTLPYNAEEGGVFSDYLHNVYGWLVVSTRFVNSMHDLIEKEIEYLDIAIMDSKTHNVRNDYKVANIIDVIDALDLNHSIYTSYNLDGMDVISVKKYALKTSKIQGHHIFKLKDHTIPVFVSETVKQIIEKQQMSGFSFGQVHIV